MRAGFETAFAVVGEFGGISFETFDLLIVAINNDILDSLRGSEGLAGSRFGGVGPFQSYTQTLAGSFEVGRSGRHEGDVEILLNGECTDA